METIRVNMTPCEDIKTIHASQNDNEAREWGFELHNNGEKIDSSSISDQMVFKAYEGGTEQILPENGSTPTTSPFKGDIKYPQGLLSDQEFLYRESPTEEDGLAKITDIKGNTLNWNQLFPTLSTGISKQNCTLTESNGVLTITPTRYDTNACGIYVANMKYQHKCLTIVDIKPSMEASVTVELGRAGQSWQTVEPNVWTRLYSITSNTTNPTGLASCNVYLRLLASQVASGTVDIKNAMCFDLTKMFGEGNEPSTVEEFTSLFSLPYYAYNQGTLLSFMGNGIKTKNANVMPKLVSGTYTANNITARVDNDGYIYVSGNAYTSGTSITIPLEESFELKKGMWCHAFNNRAEASITPTFTTWYFSLTPINRIAQCPDGADGTVVTNIRLYIGANIDPNIVLRPMMSYTNMVIDYVENLEPSTLSLPISTYFPNGMKSAGSVYDELNETKSITRVGSVDLGTLNWIHRTEIAEHIFSCDVTNSVLYKRQLSVNFEIAKYNNGGTVIGVTDMLNKDDKTLCVYFTTNTGNRYIYIKDSSFNDATALKNSLNGIYLYFELATYEETSFTTASLVTENAEIPLSNNDGVLIGKCTEELSSESGFFDAKIKLADEDGECYSNKIQLHIERSPQ